jgi:hypothetical protein
MRFAIHYSLFIINYSLTNMVSNEMFRNRRDVPPWIKGLHISEQSRDVQQFWDEELERIIHGMTVDGIYIHPWLYFYLNHWRMFVDRVDNRGDIVRVPSLPDLRDNEWIFNEIITRAEKERKGIIIFGSRRIGKSCLLASYVSHSAVIRYGSDNLIVGGSADDLNTIARYADFGLLHLHDFLRHERTGTDWTKGVEFGSRHVDNTRDVFSRITLRNVNSGKKSGEQSASGTTGSTMIFDEIGKYAVKRPFNAAKHSLSTNYGWRTSPILTGTSGEISLARDAMDLFSSPSLYNLMEMDWQLLEKNCENPTWTRKTCGHFLPGQMSLDEHCAPKIETTLDKYLGVESRDLSRIAISVTDWQTNTRNLREYFDTLKDKDRETYSQERMFLPLDPDDCFLSSSVNPFPVQQAAAHREKLVREGRTGKAVDVFFNSGNAIGYAFSQKETVRRFPYEGGTSDAPVLLFEDPPQTARFDFRYAAGLDSYKTNVSQGSSLGAFYIVKRMTDIKDEKANCIVASYCCRPPAMDLYYRNCEILQEGFGCECLMEGIDMGYEQYLRFRLKDFRLLASGQDLAQKNFNPRATFTNRYGLPPTVQNKEYIMRLVEIYCWEEVGEEDLHMPDGSLQKRKICGVERIPDICLLDEIIAYRPGLNVDRIVAFGHALALARYYDNLKIVPKTEEEYRREEAARRDRKHRQTHISPFGSIRVKAFK